MINMYQDNKNPKKIKIFVNFMGILGEKIGEKKVIMELDEKIDFKSCLKQLYEKYSTKLPKEFLDVNKETFKMIHFMRNYKDLDPISDSNENLFDNDNLYLVPPMGGG